MFDTMAVRVSMDKLVGFAVVSVTVIQVFVPSNVVSTIGFFVGEEVILDGTVREMYFLDKNQCI